MSPLARRMVANNSVARNYGLLALTVLVGLIGVSCRWTYWGVLFIVPLAGARSWSDSLGVRTSIAKTALY